jgi:uncharacterized repeat protein (TIGR03806 family)
VAAGPAFRSGALATILLLAACSGGSSGDSEPPPPVSPGGGLDERPTNTTCIAPPRPGTTTSVRLTRRFPALSFTSPVLALQAPADATRWFVVERGGRVLTFASSDDTTVATTFLDITPRVTSGGERGLLGMAFDPQFATNGLAYLNYTRGGAALQTVISRFASVDGGLTLDPNSEEILLTIDQPYSNHNGGNLSFGPDGLLYAGMGDGGSAGDPQDNAQNPARLLGKMLRIDVSGATGYAVPDDNIYADQPPCATGTGATACPEIYALGFRNPWRFSFDRDTGELWLGDVGQGDWEEIDRVVAGGNYGWRFREGAHCFEPATGCPTTRDGTPLIDPVAEYGRDLGASVTGGYVYRGAANPGLIGRYVFGDYVSGQLFAHDPGSDSLGPAVLGETGLLIASFAEDAAGELYVVDFDGSLYRMEEASGSGESTIPGLLSDTGCVSVSDPTQPASGLIPYAPQAAFWSDGAQKSRWIGLPDGQNVAVQTDGDWEFPSGTVLVQNFLLGTRLVETRLFMRHPDGIWAGYTYEWNDAQTEATRVIGGKRRTFGSDEWTYPSESDCLQCHTEAAGRTLGLETAQLNGSLTYPQTGRTANQLTTLDSIGVLAPPLPDVATLPSLADPADSTAGLGERARAWLHTNCAGCHRPGGPTSSALDLRHDTTLAATNACDVAPSSGDLGIANARLIAPGAPERSVLLARSARRDASAMPPLASTRIDDAGVALLSDWIASLGSCT